jgi:hypothetical protein
VSARVVEVRVRAAPPEADGRRPEPGIAGSAAVTALREVLARPWRELGHLIRWEADQWAR